MLITHGPHSAALIVATSVRKRNVRYGPPFRSPLVHLPSHQTGGTILMDNNTRYYGWLGAMLYAPSPPLYRNITMRQESASPA